MCVCVCVCVRACVRACVRGVGKNKIRIDLFATSQLDSTYNNSHTTIDCVRLSIRYTIKTVSYSLYKSII